VKKYLVYALICMVFLAGRARSAGAAVDLGIATGGENGTYYQFGQDLAQLLARHGIRVTVYPSAGSVQNMYTVYKVPSIPLGMVQSDVLAFVAEDGSNKILKTMAGKIKIVFPLYDEEVHIVARKEIRDFSDLAGRRVAVGGSGSGTWLTAKLLFEASGIKPERMVAIGGQEAVTQLKEGKIDAMFYVAGAPVQLFSEYISTVDGLHLVPIQNEKILRYYQEAVIPANTYPWENKPVSTVAVKAVLVAYGAPGTCADVCRLARVVYDNLEQLVTNGHPKWKAVDPGFRIQGWERLACVKRILGLPPGAKEPPGPNPLSEAIRKALP
jgi:TRAP transporter TAXI family solute receptor